MSEVAGSATAMPPGAPPTGGQCLLEPAGDGISFEWPEDGFALIPPLRIGDCDGERYGAVFVVQDSITNEQLESDPFSLCPGVFQFLGMDVHIPGTQWQPTFSILTPAGGPDARQAAVGQRWVACVVMPEGNMPYEATLRNSFSEGIAPPSLGSCAVGLDPLASKSCSTPHGVEMFAYKLLSERVPSQLELDGECEQIVRRATLMPDIFAGVH